MNRNILKKYAPQARRDFIQAVTDRASYYGLTKKKTEPVTVEGDVAVITGRAFPKKVGEQRKQLEQRVARQGFDQVMEAMAYTWFNRLVAIRFMELHGYLEHGYRVLSHPAGSNTPEILEHADSVDLPGLDSQQVIDLKLAGDKDAELYRMLLIAQCNALHKAMPFLFERIDDETELLLPDNLLHSDSLIRTLVNEIAEEDWQEVEVIGWLYQFYISEKKDEVIGKVVKSEDIPAATQLFTPNWIVKYLVQNSLGRQWMATYPNSSLKAEMEYYIEPAEQTPEVQEQLNAITPDKLIPEELTLLDPACGSGHILVEAYDLMKAIYLERGFSKKDIPRLILEKNLYGLEIDDRAAQLASLALMMKARADDRRIFAHGIQPHVLAIQESKGLDAKEITEALNAPILMTELPPSGELFEEIAEEKSPLFSKKNLSVKGDISQADVACLLDLFEHGKTYGSLIQVPEDLSERLPAIAKRAGDVMDYGGMFEQATARSVRPLLQQARLLDRTYNAVVTNPPYMGSKAFSRSLKEYANQQYSLAPGDLYTCFMIRNLAFANDKAVVSMITLRGWMFLASFENFRESLLRTSTILSFIHNGRGVWGSDFGSCCFTIAKAHFPQFLGTYRKLFTDQASVTSNDELAQRFFRTESFAVSADDLRRLPGNPIAYWVSDRVRQAFANGIPLAQLAEPRVGLQTGSNDRFIRRWYELNLNDIGFGYRTSAEASASGKRWFPYNKGGDYRKWYGNREWVVNWQNDGAEIRVFGTEDGGRPRSRAQNTHSYFQRCLSWSKVTIGGFSVRQFDDGFVFDVAGCSLFPADDRTFCLLGGILNSCLTPSIIGSLAQTVNYEVGQVSRIPIIADVDSHASDADRIVTECINLAAQDWNNHETAWDFESCSLRAFASKVPTVAECYEAWVASCQDAISRMRQLETENNRLWITAYNLDGELTADVLEDQITLYRPNREEDIQRLISYSIGCMMGRYSLDKPGLIYAHGRSEGFDSSQYESFPADDDGIIPITEFQWFDDDAANRVEQFVATAWPKANVEENLKFVAESIGQKKGESSRDAIRRYLSTGFYKHHLSLYKRRPIYWLFSSGKQRAFQCVVYLHRYNAGTLARMRTEYVIPLSGKIDARIEQLAGDIAAASSTSHAKKLTKERDTLIKHSEELLKFDEKLKHYADQRIELDLDDGVKVNYGKFGDLLAEVKAVTGQKAE